jgi:hypothetical protein
MQFREQLQMTNSDLRYIYCAGNVGDKDLVVRADI